MVVRRAASVSFVQCTPVLQLSSACNISTETKHRLDLVSLWKQFFHHAACCFLFFNNIAMICCVATRCVFAWDNLKIVSQSVYVSFMLIVRSWSCISLLFFWSCLHGFVSTTDLRLDYMSPLVLSTTACIFPLRADTPMVPGVIMTYVWIPWVALQFVCNSPVDANCGGMPVIPKVIA